MSCDTIARDIISNPSSVSDECIFNYLYQRTLNPKINLNLVKKDDIKTYFGQIQNSYHYQNILVNTTNYNKVILSIILMLIPFYYFYPRFYKIGAVGLLLGLCGFITLTNNLKDFYSYFFDNIHYYYIIASVVFYIIFFVFCNKLNHISLFFIGAIFCYLVINYILRLILLSPDPKNPYNNYRAKSNNNTSIENDSPRKGEYTEYNVIIEGCCLELVRRYKLNLPSGNMLYGYLTKFEINDNSPVNIYSDFFTNLFSPLISIFILWILGFLLSKIKGDLTSSYGLVGNNSKEKTKEFLSEKIDVLPIVGINEESFKYINCQANYILPKEFNSDFLIHDYIDKYNLDDNVYQNTYKTLSRISYEMLRRYNPKFSTYDIIDPPYCDNKELDRNTYPKMKHELYDGKEKKKIANQIFQKVIKILKETFRLQEKSKDKEIFQQIEQQINNHNESSLVIDYELAAQDILDLVDQMDIKYKIKLEILDLLKHLANKLNIENDIDEDYEDYENDATLAEKILFGTFDDNDVIQKDTKKKLEVIIKEYRKKFKEDLSVRYKTLYGYHYNIIGYNLFGKNIDNKIHYWSNYLLKNFIRVFSTWLLFAKPFGSAWLLSKYTLIWKWDFLPIFKNLTENNIIWKYFSMGLDSSYFENLKILLKKNEIEIKDDSMVNKIIYFIVTIVVTLFVTLPILYFYNLTSFGLQNYPSWINPVYQVLIILIILGNTFLTYCLQNEDKCKWLSTPVPEEYKDWKGLSRIFIPFWTYTTWMKKYLTFNIVFFIIFIGILIGITFAINPATSDETIDTVEEE
jgi:hypothetical protein